MKKIISSTLILAAMAVAFTGCLKDKGFDSHAYGINDPDTQPPGVGFPLSPKTTVALDADDADLQTAENVLIVDIFGGKAAKSDVTVTLSLNDALRTDFNTANGTNYQEMPAALFNASLTITIPAGSINATVPINVPTTVPMSPLITYAKGFTISAISNGYTIPNNFKNLLVIFSLKNKYDGLYKMRGTFYHPSQSPGFDWYAFNGGSTILPAGCAPGAVAGDGFIEMRTTGPNSCKMFVPYFGGYYHPGLFGGSLNAFGGQEPEYTVDPVTNKVTVQNVAAGAATFYTMGKNYDNAGYNSRYEPAQKTIYANFGYSMSGSNFVLGASRMWVDTLIYAGPR